MLHSTARVQHVSRRRQFYKGFSALICGGNDTCLDHLGRALHLDLQARHRVAVERVVLAVHVHLFVRGGDKLEGKGNGGGEGVTMSLLILCK
jgi:hypothetical protein